MPILPNIAVDLLAGIVDTYRMKKILLALALVSQPVMAQEVLVGLVDSGQIADRDTATVKVETIDSVAKPHSFKHADVMIDSIDSAVDQKVHILYVSAFETDPEAKRKNESILDYQTMYRGMIKMKKAGVKYICTAFDGSDEDGSKDLVGFANQLGMILVTSMGNDDNDTPYPAMLPGTVAVVSKEYRYMKHRSEAFKSRIDYTETGIVSKDVRGSSYAAARVCGKLAEQATQTRVASK